MQTRPTTVSWLVTAAALCVSGCAAPPPPLPPVHVARPAPDWFHRQLALARHARAVHLPHTDKAGAQHAYLAIMVPTCEHVARSGPVKYRPRCSALLHPVTISKTAVSTAIMSPAADQSCDLNRDDSNDSPEQTAACSD